MSTYLVEVTNDFTFAQSTQTIEDVGSDREAIHAAIDKTLFFYGRKAKEFYRPFMHGKVLLKEEKHGN